MATRFNRGSGRNAIHRSVAAPLPSYTSEPSGSPSIISFLFNATLLFLVIIVVLVIVHFTIHPIFSFMPGDKGIIPLPTASDRQNKFDKSPAGNDISGAFTDMLPCGYSVGMDLYLTGKFVEQTTPRVILYNAPAAVVSAPLTANVFPTTFPNTNIVMWLDPTLNDLYFSIITDDISGGATVETSKPIVNVPIKTPFRITYVYNQHFLEIYRNGSLEITMSYEKKPRGLTQPNPFFFGHVSSRASTMVGNVSYWPRELTSREVSAYGAPISSVALFNLTT